MQEATTELARFVARSRLDDISESTRDEAVRALVNWLGCALGGCLDTSVDAALASLAAGTGRSEATLLGRGERTDMGAAARAGAIAACILDYCDTHPMLGIAVAPAVAAALLPLAENRGSQGAEVLHAFLLGAETVCRAAAAGFGRSTGEQQDCGIVCAALGAAAACARLLALDENGTAHALERATSLAAVRAADAASWPSEWRLGAAACEGLRAALLAAGERGGEATFDCAPAKLLPDAGAASADWMRGLGTEWWFSASVYHAHPCRYELHALIETALQLKAKHGLNARGIEGIVVRMGEAQMCALDASNPRSSTEARRSAQHAVAVALLDGHVSLRHFEPARLRSPRVQGLRTRVHVGSDPSVREDGGTIEIRLRNGTSLEAPVRSRLGASRQAMDNAALNAKFRALAAETLATDQAERVLALAWNIAALADIGALIRATVPQDDVEMAELPGSPLLPR